MNERGAMRVEGLAPSAPSSAVREVAPQRTAVTQADLRAAIGRAHVRATGRAPSSALLDVLTAHASLETGRGASMFNFNFGGIKGASPRGASAACGTHEVIDGADVKVKAHFRAYGSIDEGADDYLRVMRGRFGAALGAAERGDVDGFAHALKSAGYYTASEHDYATALRGLSGMPGEAPRSTPLPIDSMAIACAPEARGGFASTADLSRVLDFLSLSPARIAAPSEDDA